MGFWRGLGRIGGQIVNVRVDQWFGWQRFKANTRSLTNTAKDLLVIQQTRHYTTYEQLIEDKQYTVNDLLQFKRWYMGLTVFHLVVGLCIFFYGIYIATQHNYLGFIMSLSLTIYSLSRSFAYHFWYFQLDQKRLGCTLHQWLDHYIGASR